MSVSKEYKMCYMITPFDASGGTDLFCKLCNRLKELGITAIVKPNNFTIDMIFDTQEDYHLYKLNMIEEGRINYTNGAYSIKW